MDGDRSKYEKFSLERYRYERSLSHLAALIVAGFIIAILGGSLLRKSEGTKKKLTVTSIAAFEDALERYKLDVGRYPSTEEGLQALFTAPKMASDWDGPYIEKPSFFDPWRESYIYRSTTDRPGWNYEIVSKGPDKVEGTEDDITNYIETEE